MRIRCVCERDCCPAGWHERRLTNRAVMLKYVQLFENFRKYLGLEIGIPVNLDQTLTMMEYAKMLGRRLGAKSAVVRDSLWSIPCTRANRIGTTRLPIL